MKTVLLWQFPDIKLHMKYSTIIASYFIWYCAHSFVLPLFLLLPSPQQLWHYEVNTMQKFALPLYQVTTIIEEANKWFRSQRTSTLRESRKKEYIGRLMNVDGLVWRKRWWETVYSVAVCLDWSDEGIEYPFMYFVCAKSFWWCFL